jgi:hypothetical protein
VRRSGFDLVQGPIDPRRSRDSDEPNSVLTRKSAALAALVPRSDLGRTQVIVTTATSDRRSYLVTGRRVYVKTAGLPPDLFAPNNAPRLILITCGGPFDRAEGSYLDNIVVFAAPA